MSYSHEIEVYVRFCETDARGHVNNTSYFLYFEEARTKFFNEVYPDRSSSFNFLLASIKCDYIQQTYAGQILKVSTNVSRLGNKSFIISQTLTEIESGNVVAEAGVVLVCFDKSKQTSIHIPDELKNSLEMHLVLN